MIYPTLMAPETSLVDATLFEAIITECDNGPHKKEEIIKLIGSPPPLANPHQNVIYKYEPDEDWKRTHQCNYWGIITSSVLSEGFQKLYWGKDNAFQTVFIMIKIINDQLYPFSNEHQSQRVIQAIMERQKYWAANQYKTFGDLDGLIKELNK